MRIKLFSDVMSKLGLSSKRKRENNYSFNLNESCPGLPTELKALTRMERPSSTHLTGDIASHFMNTPGAHKWHHYFPIYEQLFAPYLNRAISLLEIGVYKGASLKVWRDYFHRQTKIVGIDIDPDCACFENVAANVHVRIGQQQDPAFLDKIIKEFGPFDVIIDDGSHITSHMIASFCSLFGSGLKPGGLYIAEDTHTSFWPHYRDSNKSFLDFCFGLVQCMHLHYSVEAAEARYRVNGSTSVSSIEVPNITLLLEEIRFLDSIVAIRKSSGRSLPQAQHW